MGYKTLFRHFVKLTIITQFGRFWVGAFGENFERLGLQFGSKITKISTFMIEN